MVATSLRQRGTIRKTERYRLQICKKLKENLDEKINTMSENTTTFGREGRIPNQSLFNVSASSSEECQVFSRN